MATQTSRATAARAGHFCRIAHGSPRHAEARSERGGRSRGSRPRVTPEGRPRLAFLPLLSGLSETDSEPAAWVRPPRGPAAGRGSAPQRRPALGLPRTNDHRGSGSGALPPAALLLRPGLVLHAPASWPEATGPAPSPLTVAPGRSPLKSGVWWWDVQATTSSRMAASRQHELPPGTGSLEVQTLEDKTCPGKVPGTIFREE